MQIKLTKCDGYLPLAVSCTDGVSVLAGLYDSVGGGSVANSRLSAVHGAVFECARERHFTYWCVCME